MLTNVSGIFRKKKKLSKIFVKKFKKEMIHSMQCNKNLKSNFYYIKFIIIFMFKSLTSAIITLVSKILNQITILVIHL